MMPVEYASLARLWWALLAIPIILLFILRVQLRRRQVATLLFWDQLLKEQPPRAWWQRLRNLIALLLQLAFLGLLVGALIDPLWGWQKQDARQIVYVIDNSASMSARDGGESQTRLDRVRSSLTGMLGSLRQQDTAALVTAGGQPQVILGTTGDVRTLADAVDQVKPTDSPSRLTEAVELARQLMASEGQQEIIVLTDGADAATADFLESEDVTVYGFGSDTANTGITSFQVRRNLADVTSYQVLTEVTHFGEAEVECRLELELEGNIVDVVPLTLQPGVPWRRTLDYISPDGGRLVARLDVEDALATDNQALAVLPRQEPVPVLLVTPGSLFLRSVFESIPNVELTISEQLPESIPAGTILVVHRTKLDTVPTGPVLVIDPQSDSDLWKVGSSVEEPLVAKQAEDSPLMAHIRLQNVMLPGAKSLQFSANTESLLESLNQTALYSRLPRADGDVLVLSVQLEDGDLPLRIAFPVMIKNALESFLGNKGELRPSLATGQMTSVHATQPVPGTAAPAEQGPEQIERREESDSRHWTVRSPAGELEKLSSAEEQLNVGPFDAVGLWLVGPGTSLVTEQEAPELSEDVVPIAVNLANPGESELRPATELPAAPLAAGVWGGHSFWFYLSLLALAGICVEWVLYQRRIVA